MYMERQESDYSCIADGSVGILTSGSGRFGGGAWSSSSSLTICCPAILMALKTFCHELSTLATDSVP